MRYLPDTHTLLWALTEPPQLGLEAHQIIAARSSQLVVSAATEEHALLAGKLEWPRRDPFDRMLAAQAMLESLTLVTNDEALTSLPSLATAW